jgi:putative Holliday junction resolvase
MLYTAPRAENRGQDSGIVSRGSISDSRTTNDGKMRILALDIGTKNIGVALSDESGIIAQGKEVIRRKSDAYAIARVKDILEGFDVKEIIVGLPINMDGTKGKRAKDSIGFAENLEQNVHIPVKFWDERLSTKEAEDIMIRADITRNKRKKIVDKLAAQIILQGYLDSQRSEIRGQKSDETHV